MWYNTNVMNKKATFLISPLAACLAGLFVVSSGCMSGGSCEAGTLPLPAEISNVAVLAKDRDSLKRAIVVAATRRRWTPSEIAPNVIRCTLIQRQHKVEVDLTLTKDNAYSITCRFCNIPEKKYYQWINNLQREIAKQLTMP